MVLVSTDPATCDEVLQSCDEALNAAEDQIEAHKEKSAKQDEMIELQDIEIERQRAGKNISLLGGIVSNLVWLLILLL